MIKDVKALDALQQAALHKDGKTYNSIAVSKELNIAHRTLVLKLKRDNVGLTRMNDTKDRRHVYAIHRKSFEAKYCPFRKPQEQPEVMFPDEQEVCNTWGRFRRVLPKDLPYIYAVLTPHIKSAVFPSWAEAITKVDGVATEKGVEPCYFLSHRAEKIVRDTFNRWLDEPPRYATVVDCNKARWEENPQA